MSKEYDIDHMTHVILESLVKDESVLKGGHKDYARLRIRARLEDLLGLSEPTPELTKEVKEEKLFWCLHLQRKYSHQASKYRWFFKNPSKPWSEAIADEWLACPVCCVMRPTEAPRPESEPKSNYEKIIDEVIKHQIEGGLLEIKHHAPDEIRKPSEPDVEELSEVDEDCCSTKSLAYKINELVRHINKRGAK